MGVCSRLSLIRHLHISHNTPRLPSKLISFLLGITTVPREFENSANANFFLLAGAESLPADVLWGSSVNEPQRTSAGRLGVGDNANAIFWVERGANKVHLGDEQVAN